MTPWAAYGDALGISFQIADDLLDYGGASSAMGRKTSVMISGERKMSLPLIKALAHADETELEFWNRTIAKGRQEDGDLEHALELMGET